MARTVLAGSPNRRATCLAAALSQASPTASSNRLLNGALLGSCGTFSILIPQSGQHTRYTSMTTVVRNSMHGRSRTSRSLTSCAVSSFRPHPEQISFRLPRFRRIHSFSVFAFSLISCRYTRYPGHPSSLVSSLSRKPLSVPKSLEQRNSRLLRLRQIPAQSLKMSFPETFLHPVQAVAQVIAVVIQKSFLL